MQLCGFHYHRSSSSTAAGAPDVRPGFGHLRGKPYHPITQGKIERYHRSMKTILPLDHYYSPEELTVQIAAFIQYYDHHRYHESLANVAPAHVYNGRAAEILERCERIKLETIVRRRKEYRKAIAARQTIS